MTGYAKLIMDMLSEIADEDILRRIYNFIAYLHRHH